MLHVNQLNLNSEITAVDFQPVLREAISYASRGFDGVILTFPDGRRMPVHRIIRTHHLESFVERR